MPTSRFIIVLLLLFIPTLPRLLRLSTGAHQFLAVPDFNLRNIPLLNSAYAATHNDIVFSGLYALSLPSSKEASHVTCTGAPFDPDNDERRHIGADPLDSSPAQLPIIPTPSVLLRLGQHNVSWFSVSQSC